MAKAKVKKVIKGLEKASKMHKKQANTLKTVKFNKGGGVKVRGTGAATKGLHARGPMG
tara:strand:- start:2962 stop:3135 length:174 start_codon:yes stop_codon:yes gene_type:complete